MGLEISIILHLILHFNTLSTEYQIFSKKTKRKGQKLAKIDGATTGLTDSEVQPRCSDSCKG